MTDLSASAFTAIRERLFTADAQPIAFSLRDKRNTQDDPLDEHIGRILESIPSARIKATRAPGPLIAPDLVLYRPQACASTPYDHLRSDSTAIVGIEVKKLQRGASGRVARPSAMDYNTTPPCGTMRIYDRRHQPLDIRGFYLFVCQERHPNKANTYVITALVLCDGDLLNADFNLYLSVTGPREKQIGLGTYQDGANRVRPMLLFANPLGLDFLDHHATLIHPNPELNQEHPNLQRVATIERTIPHHSSPQHRLFHCYRDKRTTPSSVQAVSPIHHLNPFPTPHRSQRTARRGRFILDITPVFE